MKAGVPRLLCISIILFLCASPLVAEDTRAGDDGAGGRQGEAPRHVVSIYLSSGANWLSLDKNAGLLLGPQTILDLNHTGATTAGLGYKLGSFRLGASMRTDAGLGPESRIRDLYSSWTGRHWGLLAYYQAYEGFYMTSQESSAERLNPDDPYEYPSLRLMGTGLSTYWFPWGRGFDFSLRDGLDDPRLGFTPFALAKAAYFNLSNDAPLLGRAAPDLLAPEYYDITWLRSIQGSLAAGLAFVLPLGPFYIAPAAYAGLSGSYAGAGSAERGGFSAAELSGFGLVPDFGFKAQLGFTSRRLSFGVGFAKVLQRAALGELLVELANLQATFFCSLRF